MKIRTKKSKVAPEAISETLSVGVAALPNDAIQASEIPAETPQELVIPAQETQVKETSTEAPVNKNEAHVKVVGFEYPNPAAVEFGNKHRYIPPHVAEKIVARLFKSGTLQGEPRDNNVVEVPWTMEVLAAVVQEFNLSSKQRGQGNRPHQERKENRDNQFQSRGVVGQIDAMKALTTAFEDLAFVKEHNSYMVRKGLLKKYEDALANAGAALEGENPNFAAIKRIAEENGREAQIAALENLEQDVHYQITKASPLPLYDEKQQAVEIRKTFDANRNISRARNAFLDLRRKIREAIDKAADEQKKKELDQASQKLQHAMKMASQTPVRK